MARPRRGQRAGGRGAVQLSKQQVPHIVARAVRRNASAMKFFKRSGFDWVRTEEYLLGRDM